MACVEEQLRGIDEATRFIRRITLHVRVCEPTVVQRCVEITRDHRSDHQRLMAKGGETREAMRLSNPHGVSGGARRLTRS